MYYYMYITYCCILTILICTTATDAVNICPSHTILVSTSGIIESPGYPEKYNSKYDCTLNLLVPSLTNIEFTVNGEYDVNAYQGKCEDNNDHLRLVTPSRTTQLCGTRTNNEVLGSYYNDGEINATVTFKFKSRGYLWFWSKYIFRIRYTVLTTTTTSSTTTRSTTATSTSASTSTSITTTSTTTSTVASTSSSTSASTTIISSPTPATPITAAVTTVTTTTATTTTTTDAWPSTTALTQANSTNPTNIASNGQDSINWTTSTGNSTAAHSEGDNTTSNALTRNILIGSGVALVMIIVIIAAAVMFRKRQQKSKDSAIALNTILTQHNDCTDNHYTNTDGSIDSGGASNYILAEPVLDTSGQTDRGGDNSTTRGTGSTTAYMLAEPFGSDEERTDGITINTSDYILAGPCDEYANVDAINRVQKEREIKDVYADIPAHLTTSKTVEPTMVDNELYGT